MQAARYYGADNLPQKVREKLGRDAGSRPDQVERLTYIQAVQPNDEYTPGRLGPKGKPWLSTHVCMEMATVVKQGGMYEPNFSAPRWDVDGNEAFGRGLGYLTLAAGTKLQAMTRDNLQAGALAARPPMGTTGTRSMRRDAKIAPGAFLHGAVSHTGQQLVRPMFTFNGLPITIEQEKHAKEEVENGWHAALLSLTGRTGLGNLEVIERMEERLRLNAPFLGRMQSEGLTAVLERRFAMLFRAGQIPDPPKEMAGKPLEMKFTSVAAMAQKSQEGVAVARILEDAYKLASSNPSQADAVWDKVDIDASMDVLAEARGAPATIMRSPEEVQRRREERAKQIEQERMMAMMQQGAGAAKDAAGAMSQMAPEDVA